MISKFSFYLFIMMINGCSSSLLLDKLRKHKSVTYLSELSSPDELVIDAKSPFRLTCAFLSNFDKVDLVWFHNGTLLQSFLSKSIVTEEDDNVESSYLASTIVSTIELEKTHSDINGVYQCVAMHGDIIAQHSFNIHVNTDEIQTSGIKLSEDALITVHTYQTLFEPRSQTSLMCRFNEQHQKNTCTAQWFDPEDNPLNTLGEKNDLLLNDANFEDHMGLYKCQICCHNQCRTLTSFVYPAGLDK